MPDHRAGDLRLPGQAGRQRSTASVAVAQETLAIADCRREERQAGRVSLQPMYAPYFGLTKAPFSIAPDPRLLFMSEQHREALAHLLYGLGGRDGAGGGGGFVLLTGEIGTGKTTVCRLLLEQVPAHCNVAYIFNPKLTAIELLQSICDEFHIAVPQKQQLPPTVKDYLDPLNAFLLQAHAAGRNNVLIIDEAQKLSASVLEQLRLLTNLETSERKLLQIVLIGQPQLRKLLRRPELEQLAQRVIARFHLRALDMKETVQYIRHRLEVCGLNREMPFDPAALQRIHHISRGVPRRINLLCDRALLGAFSSGESRVNRRIVDKAAAEVFDEPAAPAVPALWRRSLALVGLSVAAAAVLVGVIRVVAPPSLQPATAAPAVPATRGAAPAAQRLSSPGAAPTAPPAAPAPAAAAPAAQASTSAAKEAAAQPLVPAATAPTPTAALGAAPAAAQSPAAAAADASSSRSAPAPGSTAVAPRLLSDQDQAWRELAAAWKLSPTGGKPCELMAREQVNCYSGKTSLALIRQLARPGILTLDPASAAPSYALLTGLGENSATLRAGDSVQTVTLTALAARWQGDFSTLWRAPAGYEARLGSRQNESASQWLATQLALATDRPPPTAQSGATPLAGQLRAFQRAQGLPVNGQPGPLTYMQLNRSAGVDEPRLRTER